MPKIEKIEWKTLKYTKMESNGLGGLILIVTGMIYAIVKKIRISKWME